jgi:hypothetical protein
MRRVLPVLPAVLLPFWLLAGCDGDVALPPGPPGLGPTPQIRVSFPPGGIADTIVVAAIERLPLRSAELVAPNGAITRASNIDVDAAPRFATGQWAAGDPWRTSLNANGGAAVLTPQHAEAGAALESRQQILATVSTADIPLPDPVAYRRDWLHYRVRLSFGTPPGEVETREFAAPQPPPR